MTFLQQISFRKLWLIAIVFITITAWQSEGYFHVDEHFQLLEFAQYKLDNQDLDNLPWEFNAHLRPGLQVYLTYVILKTAHTFGIQNPFFIAFTLRFLTGLLALLAVFLLSQSLFKDSEQNKKLFILVSIFLWFMPYLMVRFSSENWSAIFIVFAMVSVLNKQNLMYAGILAGLSFCFRYQAAFFILGLGSWLLFVQKSSFKDLFKFIFGSLLALFVGILADRWMYGEWAFSAYNYFYVNLIEGKAAEFGTEPFYYYFIKIFETAVLPFGLLILFAYGLFLYKFRKNIIAWVSLPFFILHCLIGHKELRFLFPLVYFIPPVLVLVYEQALMKSSKTGRALLMGLLAINFLLLPFSSFKASNPRISLLNHLYKEDLKADCYKENPYFDVHWYRFYFSEKFDPKQLNTFGSIESQNNLSKVIVPNYNAPDSLKGLYNYKQIPKWVEPFNYFNWLNRSNTWCIVEVGK